MRVLDDYVCKKGHTTERFIEPDSIVNCPICEGLCERVLSSPSVLRMNGAPINIMSDQWARTREKNYIRTKERDG